MNYLKLIPLVLLASCTTTTGPTGSTTTTVTPSSIQAGILKGCGWYEELAPLAQILTSFVPVPGVSEAQSIIDMVCKAEIQNAARPRGPRGEPPPPATVVVNGKTVVLYGSKRVN